MTVKSFERTYEVQLIATGQLQDRVELYFAVGLNGKDIWLAVENNIVVTWTYDLLQAVRFCEYLVSQELIAA